MTQPIQSKERRADDQCRQAQATAARLILIGHWAGVLTAVGGIAVLAGYSLGIEMIYRPLPGGPAMHPLTAIMFVCAGSAVASMRAMRTPTIAIAVLFAVGLVGLTRIFEVVSGAQVLNVVPLFTATLAREVAEGTPVMMAWNMSTMFVLVAAAFLLRKLGLPYISQTVGAAATVPPLVSLTGYLYGIPGFHGAMSRTTMVLGLMLAPTPLLLGARLGIARAISSPWVGGRFGRLQIAVISSVVFTAGFIIQHTLEGPGAKLMPMFVVFTLLAVSTTIAFCSVIIERNDSQRRRAERTVAYLVLHDPLSGLLNRRFLVEQEENIINSAREQFYPISVLMIDIDRFKSVNDEFGHQVGDTVICRLATTLKKHIRGSDIALRYGGEELLALLIDADLASAMRMADGIRSSIAAIDFSDLGFDAITVSIGVAQLQTTMSEAISRADKALYAAKESGRNQVHSTEIVHALERAVMAQFALPELRQVAER
jgi:diguanylate cyclase (GGDEF)-like protein